MAFSLGSGLSGLIIAATVIASTAACTPRIDSRGHVIDPEKMSQITPGKSRDDVRDALGSPSSIGVLDKESWYYLSQRTETVAFFSPKLTERQVVVVRFDPQGVVSDIHVLAAEDGKTIELNERITPTSGNELGFFEQIFGNFGKYNPPARSAPRRHGS
ncbi:MAG: outer membrane protein assembly factor BamE [Rhodospirillales bacterium]|nr:outer membrane protein assembly factor BamE [Rhodospirillales bacterium]